MESPDLRQSRCAPFRATRDWGPTSFHHRTWLAELHQDVTQLGKHLIKRNSAGHNRWKSLSHLHTFSPCCQLSRGGEWKPQLDPSESSRTAGIRGDSAVHCLHGVLSEMFQRDSVTHADEWQSCPTSVGASQDLQALLPVRSNHGTYSSTSEVLSRPPQLWTTVEPSCGPPTSSQHRLQQSNAPEGLE